MKLKIIKELWINSENKFKIALGLEWSDCKVTCAALWSISSSNLSAKIRHLTTSGDNATLNKPGYWEILILCFVIYYLKKISQLRHKTYQQLYRLLVTIFERIGNTITWTNNIDVTNRPKDNHGNCYVHYNFFTIFDTRINQISHQTVFGNYYSVCFTACYRECHRCINLNVCT